MDLESIDILGARMKLSSDLVAEIVEVIEESGAVPIPGGHGTWFPDVRERYRDLAASPGPVARSFICLIMLGDGDGEERWNPKEWWLHALAWFDVYCPQIATKLDGPRWPYLLAAMLRMVENWAQRLPETMHLQAYARDCHRRAEERLTAITRRAVNGVHLSEPVFSPVGIKLADGDRENWCRVVDALGAQDAGRLELVYFLYVFHSSLGIAQHSLDERYASRVPFYSQMRLCLANMMSSDLALARAAVRIDGMLAKTALLTKAGQDFVATNAATAALPDCFQLAHHYSRPPLRAVAESWLAQQPEARDRLLAVHDLAVAMADLSMDFFRSGGDNNLGFRQSAYDYLHSIIRYGPKMFEQQKSKDEIVPTPIRDSKNPTFGRPMTRSFAERMRSGQLFDPAQAQLNELLPFLPATRQHKATENECCS